IDGVLQLIEDIVHIGRSERIDTDDLSTRLRSLDGDGNARNQAAAAYRYDHALDLRKLLQNFEANRAATSHHQRVVVGRQIDRAGFTSQSVCLCLGSVKGFTEQDRLTAQPAHAVDLAP